MAHRKIYIVAMQAFKRRVIYTVFYELFAIILTSIGLMLLGNSGSKSTMLAVLTSAIAIGWNLIWNWIFESWESRQQQKGRSLARRIVHSIGFEGGLAVMLIPLVAWILGTDLLTALAIELGLLAFFLIYTYIFTWCFDKIFGLPNSAKA